MSANTPFIVDLLESLTYAKEVHNDPAIEKLRNGDIIFRSSCLYERRHVNPDGSIIYTVVYRPNKSFKRF